MSAAGITVEHSWSTIDAMTRSMRAAAKDEDWTQVLELSGSRHLYLMTHFKQFPVGPENAEFYQSRLMHVLEGEKELQLLATNARREIMRQGLISTQNHRAVGAYLQQ